MTVSRRVGNTANVGYRPKADRCMAQPRPVKIGIFWRGHASRADKCLLFWAKRTLTDSCSPISIYEYTA